MAIASDINNLKIYSTTESVDLYDAFDLQEPEKIIFERYLDAYEDKCVLDIGVGAGRTTPHLIDRARHYIGVDYSESMVRRCHENFPGGQFIHADVRNMNMFDDDAFDFVLFSYNGLDCISHEGRLMALTEIRRVLKQDGYFVFSSHNRSAMDTPPTPRLRLSLNPRRMAYHVYIYIHERINYYRTRPLTVATAEYMMINDGSQNFQLVYYYIDIPNQVHQLKQRGFAVLDIYNLKGEPVTSLGDDKSPWLYYVTRYAGNSVGPMAV